MSLVAIDIVRTEYNKPGTALVNPDQVVAIAQPRQNPNGWTDIFLNSYSEDGSRRTFTTAQNIQQLLAALGPFIQVKRLELETGDNWPVWYIRPSAIVALKPVGDANREGRGRLYLTGGGDLWVNYAAVAESLR